MSDTRLQAQRTAEPNIKSEVRSFYDQVGWQLVGEQVYQNARYEDLRPVASEYIHRCHLRLARHINPSGRYLLDAGSGPIQYPEYLEYSRQYQYRVCADISITALQEARRRIGEHGLYVVADIANLPFKNDCFQGVVSLHTIHHLPEDEHLTAYQELHRVLAAGSRAAVVNGWPAARLMVKFEPLVRLANRLRGLGRRVVEARRQQQPDAIPSGKALKAKKRADDDSSTTGDITAPKGTFTNRHDFAWITGQVGAHMPLEIFVWRSVSVRFLRALIHPWLGGRCWLRLLYQLEERYPHYFGQNGQYPLIVIQKR